MEEQGKLPRADQESSRRIGSSAGKLKRISHHTEGMMQGLREWVDLRIELVKAEIEEQAIEAISIAVIAALAGIFSLVTFAIGLGWLLGHPFWGFLFVTCILVHTSLAIGIIKRPELFQAKRSKAQPKAMQYETNVETRGNRSKAQS